MTQNNGQTERRQYLINTLLNYLGEHYDSSRLYEMLHDEMGFSVEDIEELGFELSEYRSYEWKEGDVRRHYAAKLDSVLPKHDVLTTTAWIKFAEDLAEGTETEFKSEAEMLIAAFKEIAGRCSPEAIAEIYATVHMPDNSLLANEILAAAEYAEQGMCARELSDMAHRGEFMHCPYPVVIPAEEETTDGHSTGNMNGIASM